MRLSMSVDEVVYFVDYVAQPAESHRQVVCVNKCVLFADQLVGWS